ncbi:PREDICTED: ankyrin [Prunus dulcis]|uniref:PREDICTED: ankyrin n=1 Tax=Prunus dulcis TaxID=3755 RepID=A0A5E4GKB7_PRUDU|nr:PREDICTED: ankyrin [Prunus dulcis]
MVKTVVPADAIVVEVLNKDNYEHWSALVTNYLVAQDLWEVVEATAEPPKPEQEAEVDDQFKAWRKKNATALHTIQVSCGPDAFSMIKEISSAKIAWDTLAKKLMPQPSLLINSFVQSANSSSNPDAAIAAKHDPYQPFFAAVKLGDWRKAQEFLTRDPNAIRARYSTGGTALHIATTFGHEHIVQELVQLMTPEDLEMQDATWTALHLAARLNLKMVECMVTKNRKLLGIVEESHGLTPILFAAKNDLWAIVRYLYSLTPIEDLKPENGPYGAGLVCFCFYAKQFDIAWELLQRCPRLVIAKSPWGGSPIFDLADIPSAFPSGMRLKFWEKWIYDGIHIQHPPAIHDVHVNVENLEEKLGNQNISFSVFGFKQGPSSSLRKLLGINRICEMKLIHARSLDILDYMGEVLKHLDTQEMVDGLVYAAIFRAVRSGIIEFIIRLCKVDPDILWQINSMGRNIFHYSIECRQEKVYSLIYGVGQRNLIATFADASGNDMLHLAGMLSPTEKLDRISGAALQMQRERQWFKEVKSLVVLPSGVGAFNKQGMRPHEVFTQNHNKLKEEGEKWMKDTATSCTVVAFTVPGGNNGGTGFPLFLDEKMFMVFIVSDAISLFSSTTSVLMFLGILTSRYAEDDFLKSLPTKMIIGLSTLLISIASMMVAFCSALFLMLHERLWIVIPIIFLASVPVTLFIWMQFPLLVEIFISTHGGGIFDKKVRRWI